MSKADREMYGHYVVEIDDESFPDSPPNTVLVIKTTDGPEGSKPEPLTWVAMEDLAELIKDLSEFLPMTTTTTTTTE